MNENIKIAYEALEQLDFDTLSRNDLHFLNSLRCILSWAKTVNKDMADFPYIPVDAKVWVRCPGENYVRRHAKQVNADGSIEVFPAGTTSFTSPEHQNTNVYHDWYIDRHYLREQKSNK